MTYIDKTFNLFFTEAGGADFLGLIFAIILIITIIMALIKPFDF